MAEVKILIAGGEGIVARDIQNTLTKLGYAVPAVVASGEAAIEKAAEIRPDLVLMGVALKGEVDSVEAARQIRARFDIPVVYLTARADDKTLQRAKVTEPFGYVLKPFEKRELSTHIEMALHKHKVERELRALREREAHLITKRVRTEEAITRAREEWKRTFDTVSDLIMILDRQCRIVRANKALAAKLGIMPSEVVGLTCYNAIHATQEPPPFCPHAQLLADDQEHGVEIYEERLGGDYFVTVSPLHDAEGRLIGSVHVAREITERKRTEEALQRRNRELALLNQVGQELTATLDLQQVIERLLREVTGIIGAEGGSVWLWDEEREGWLACGAIFTQGRRRPPVNLRLRPGEGVAGWVAQKGESAIVDNAPGDPRFFPGVDEQTGFRTISLLAVPLRVRDAVIGVLELVNKLGGDFGADDLALVETLAASASIAIENARLVEALRQHTVELEVHNEELDAFVHTVAHDLKNLLGLTVGFADVLEEDYATMSRERLRKYLHTIAQNGRKMNNIIDELLLLAGVRKMEVIIRPLDMASIVAEAQQRLAHMIEEHQAEIVVPKGWPMALGYGPWVEEVWVNYLSNALIYGGRPPRVELGATAQADDVVRFWVRDNGQGIPPEAQGRLFTPFMRLDRVRAKGHGLGLSIVRRIVEKLGGQVGVESEIGVGSTFWFTLPTSN
jgi:PAS domain S-box-containing protein